MSDSVATTPVDMAAFEAALQAEGYKTVPRVLPAGTALPEHVHAFDAKALISAGEIAITCAGETRSYRAGDVFTVPRGTPHAEVTGPQGVSYLVGHRA